MSESYSRYDWKDILQKLADIRDQKDYSPGNVDFIREQLQSSDDRIRGGAALTAGDCIFEPFILDLLLELAETDNIVAIRKATIQSLEAVINEGVERNFENEIGADSGMENLEEWDELQDKSLQEDYQRVKNFLFSLSQDDFEDQEIRETALVALSDLGFLYPVQELIQDFIEREESSAQWASLHAMGKYPQYWIKYLSRFLDLKVSKPLLLEAISSSYSSRSKLLAQKIENLLSTDDPDILSYSLLTLTNINKSENLGEILKKFSLSQAEQVRETARQALNQLTQTNFSNFLHDELGLEDE